jgi:putative SOS response-associated peptidase YedK
VHRRDNQPLVFAGLWDHWGLEDQTIQSHTIIVTDVDPMLRSMRSRMPVILSPEAAWLWLLARVHDPDRLKRLLTPYAPPELEAYRVSTRVNDIRNDDPALIEPTQP